MTPTINLINLLLSQQEERNKPILQMGKDAERMNRESRRDFDVIQGGRK